MTGPGWGRLMRGVDWPGWFRRFAATEGWLPRQVLDELTVPQFWILYGFGDGPKRTGWAAVRDEVNRRQLAKGLPPLPEPEPPARSPRRARNPRAK